MEAIPRSLQPEEAHIERTMWAAVHAYEEMADFSAASPATMARAPSPKRSGLDVPSRQRPRRRRCDT
jgi:hypothetical protein